MPTTAKTSWRLPLRVPVYSGGASAAAAGIQAQMLNVPPPSDDDGWLDARGGFCVERRLPDNDRSITAIAFAPDGRMFLALDSPPVGEVDNLVLYDANHPVALSQPTII